MQDLSSFVHPCLTCGACCASFRVAFYWREAESADNDSKAVPQGSWEELTETQRCMKGTAAKHHPKCVELKGRIGERVACNIYEQRPTPCRQFTASYEKGHKNERCDQARQKHGLSQLRREDWPRHNSRDSQNELIKSEDILLQENLKPISPD